MIKQILTAGFLLILLVGCNSSETVDIPQAEKVSVSTIESKASSTEVLSVTSVPSSVVDSSAGSKGEASTVAAPTPTPKPSFPKRVVEKVKEVLSTVQKTPVATPTNKIKIFIAKPVNPIPSRVNS